MTQEELNKKLELHREWLYGNGKSGKRADFKNEDLRGADLRGADLSCANLSGANLSGANLIRADLIRADLSGANLRGADLSCANLSGANLSGANLIRADLIRADLSGANLRGADFYCADLSGANLSGANLKCANLYNAILMGAKNIPFIPMLIPEGECIVWKKVYDYIIKLKLLEDSKRSRATSNKCRCDKALVLDIQHIDGTPSGLREILNYNYTITTYKVGEVVYADSWDDDRWAECSHGIHFFIDRQSAVEY